VPLAAGTSRDAYHAAYSSALEQAFAQFDPEFVLVSAGFDCLADDPLGGLLLEPEDLHGMTSELLRLCRDSAAGGRLALTLEGGYQPQRTARAVVEVFHALIGLPSGR
jgi:acetoin utilization deacetylase AcuC-like enzyme